MDKLVLRGKYKKRAILHEDRVVMIRDATTLHGKWRKEISLFDILGIEVKEPILLNSGFILFKTADFNGMVSDFACNGGSLTPGFDENAVVFSDKESYKVALEMQKYIINYKNSAPVKKSLADEIQKFKHLLDSGAITEDEYIKAKQNILG